MLAMRLLIAISLAKGLVPEATTIINSPQPFLFYSLLGGIFIYFSSFRGSRWYFYRRIHCDGRE